MSTRGVTLVPGTIVVLSLDGTLAYVEDVQPTFAAVVALPEQMPTHKETQVFTPGRVGAKKISPFSAADKVVEVAELTQRNRDFIGTYEQLRKAHGPNFVSRTPEEQAAEEAKNVSVTKVHPTRAPRGSVTPDEKKDRRAKRRAAKVPCVKCKMLPVHPNHHGGGCDYEAPEKKTRGGSPKSGATEPKSGNTFRVVNPDITALQAANDKFAQGNRFYRVFLALRGLPESTGTLANVIAAMAQDAGKPMTNPEKVARRALKALCTAGNVQTV
jgi:hypothetical protein